MALNALRGALGFLTRLPLGHDPPAWKAFRTTPAVFPIAGYAIGVILILPLLLPIPAVSMAIVFVIWLYLVTGINHLDGVADLADAAVVHGDAEERRVVMKDTTVGVGAVLGVVVVVFGVGLAGFALATAPLIITLIIITAEVGAKASMAMVACLGTPTHEGLGSQLTDGSSSRAVIVPLLISIPAAVMTYPSPAALVTLGSSLLAGSMVYWSSIRRLGGISGDVFGATNEIARVVGLHAGVIAWMHW